LGTFTVMTQFFNSFKRSLELLTTASWWMPLLLLGSGAISLVPSVSAQQRLPEPRIFDELPPASPSPLPSLNFPTPSLPPASPNEAPTGRELNFQAPNPPIAPSRPTQISNLYRVDIFGGSSLLLAQVRQIEPKAFVREGDRVIQAGVFAEQFNAQLRVRALEAQGIRARVVPIAAGVGIDTVDFGRFSSERRSPVARRAVIQESLERSYLVIIPGNSRDLPDMVERVVRLGVSQSAISQREAPRGPHIAIGPFKERGEADRWNSYLRSKGMDARVYFGS
jgi:hypothetical protein